MLHVWAAVFVEQLSTSGIAGPKNSCICYFDNYCKSPIIELYWEYLFPKIHRQTFEWIINLLLNYIYLKSGTKQLFHIFKSLLGLFFGELPVHVLSPYLLCCCCWSFFKSWFLEALCILQQLPCLWYKIHLFPNLSFASCDFTYVFVFPHRNLKGVLKNLDKCTNFIISAFGFWMLEIPYPFKVLKKFVLFWYFMDLCFCY